MTCACLCCRMNVALTIACLLMLNVLVSASGNSTHTIRPHETAAIWPNSTRRARQTWSENIRQSPIGSARVSDKSSDFVWSQTCLFNLDMYGFCRPTCVWSCRKQSLCVRLVEFGNDTTRPDQRYFSRTQCLFTYLSRSCSIWFIFLNQRLNHAQQFLEYFYMHSHYTGHISPLLQQQVPVVECYIFHNVLSHECTFSLTRSVFFSTSVINSEPLSCMLV